ncbi:MAG: DUF1573 domain-containing protein [Bacteroidia bacterium]|nr:DUF1573 domain-containing protein [Bacteroidia bacterium]
MKKFFFFILISSICIVSGAQEIKFNSKKYNFGFVHEGDTVKIQYELKNIGLAPLVISDYEIECGCTVMEMPDVPIQPGETYLLNVRFDTHNKYDRQEREIKIISNAPDSPHILVFKGVVLKPKKKS